MFDRKEEDKFYNSLKTFDFTDFGPNEKEDLIEHLEAEGVECECEEGVSKLVIMLPHNTEYVYKFPYQYDGPTGEEFHSLTGYWDYCELEVLNYISAKEKELDKYFAEISLWKIINDYHIYRQDYCIMYENKYTELKQHNEMIFMEEYELNDERLPNMWAFDFIERYDKEELQKLLEFVDESSINDLHWENVGYFNGRPVLVDYSGFYE